MRASFFSRGILSKRLQKNTSGVSLLEMIIAISIFALVMTTTVELFSRMVSTKSQFDRIRETHEKAQIAVDIIAKSVRSGAVVDPLTTGQVSTLRIYDYFQEDCIEYRFTGDGKLTQQFAQFDLTTPGERGRSDCDASTTLNGSAGVLVEKTVEGTFDVVETSSSQRGFVTILMNLVSQEDAADEAAKTPIEMTVSLRNKE